MSDIFSEQQIAGMRKKGIVFNIYEVLDSHESLRAQLAACQESLQQEECRNIDIANLKQQLAAVTKERDELLAEAAKDMTRNKLVQRLESRTARLREAFILFDNEAIKLRVDNTRNMSLVTYWTQLGELRRLLTDQQALAEEKACEG